MSDNPYYYPQEDQMHQYPAKKRKHRFIKVLAILLIIAILSMTVVNNFLEPVLISRLTKGVLFGYHSTQVTAHELENVQNLTQPTDKEIRDFGKFAKKLSNRILLSFTREQKEHFKDIKNSAKQLTDFIRRTESAENSSGSTGIIASGAIMETDENRSISTGIIASGATTETDESRSISTGIIASGATTETDESRSKNNAIGTSNIKPENPEFTVLSASCHGKAEITPDKSLASFLYFDLASVALRGAQSSLMNTDSVGEEEDDEDIYDPAVLNDIATLLYTTGYPELASMVTAMTAAEHPEDPRSALNFATLLRESNADQDAFHVLQYALRLSPNSAPVLYSLGMCALDLRNTPYAERCFMKMLSLDGSSGPGHQGMMLCYMDTGDYSSAFLHMLEGAREGYTSMVTETYKTLRQKNQEYLEGIAKPIFEQYTLMQLMDFTKSRTPFDDTLDTPAGQLEIPREINLGRDSVGVYSASETLLNDGMQYGMSAYEHGKTTFEDAFGMLQGLGGLTGEDGKVNTGEITKEISKLLLEKIFGAAESGQTVSSGGWLQISYEAEVFWLNILEDYTQIKVGEYLEEYFEKPYEEAFKNPDSVSPSLMQYNEFLFQRAESSPLQVGSQILNNLINNNSVYDTGVQKANKQDMDKFLETINPKLEEGYNKTADLMEEYWTYYGGILGHIGNDETYNRYQQSRKTTVATALAPYVIGGTINGFLVTMNFIAVDSDNFGSTGGVKLPSFPDFPESQMGERYEPPAPPRPPAGEEPQGGNPSQEEGTIDQQEGNPGSGENSSETGETGPGQPGGPGTTGLGEPGGSGTAGPITTEQSITVSLGPFSASFNGKTGYEIDLTFIGSTNLRFNPRTRDLSLFGGIGASLGVATSGVSARTGVYTTVNLGTWGITSGTRSTLEGQLAGNGIGVENQTCFATGADKTTVSAILLHRKSSQTIDNN